MFVVWKCYSFLVRPKQLTTMTPVSNHGEFHIETQIPFTVHVSIQGDAPLLLHAWSNEDVKAKSEAKKGSSEKRTDNLESYIHRNDDKHICLPGEYLRQSMILAAKNQPDPRSPRKSMMDLAKASLVVLNDLSVINGGVTEWDYLDQRRVVIQRSGVTRQRPAFKSGWVAGFSIMSLSPEYIDYQMMYRLLCDAGRFCGLGDFRPTFGRFMVISFEKDLE